MTALGPCLLPGLQLPCGGFPLGRGAEQGLLRQGHEAYNHTQGLHLHE